MKGDFSRQTFDPTKHFTTVRMQQGRVQLDADWNEQADLALHRIELEAADVIGGCGGPLDAAAFGIVLDLDDLDPTEKTRLEALDPTYAIAAGDFVLTPGRYYVDGVLCASEHAVPYTLQPDLPGLDPVDVSQGGFTIVYLDVWQRHLTWLDDPLLRETALGGPDTATRTKTVWQVRTGFLGPDPVTCVDDPQEYLDAIAAGTGLVSARATREDIAADPCIVPASAGYRGLENQLYRGEIHSPGQAYDLTAGAGAEPITVAAPDQVVYASGSWSEGETVEIFRSASGSDPMEGWLATIVANDAATGTLTLNRSLPDLGPADLPRIRSVEATFKWSRDNGSVVTLVSSVSARDVVVTSLGPDDSRFLPGQWVELVDEVTELDTKPGFLAQIEDLDRASRTVTLGVEPPTFTGETLKLRRWDGVGAVKTNPPSTTEPFVELEDGVQVSFSDGTYKTGDYWLIPARTATADERSGAIEWPVDEDGEPLALEPLGIRHHYCKLAILEWNGTTLELEDDCRSLFPPLTQLATLVYVGGDGQEARPGQPVPQLLEAGVFRGRRPVEGAIVRFTADAGGGVAADLASVGGGGALFTQTTGADGIAACAWLPANDLSRPSQTVEARLLDAGGSALAPQIDYHAQLSIASEVAYTPGACSRLTSATTVQDALDTLCSTSDGEEPGIRIRAVFMPSIGDLLNHPPHDYEVRLDTLVEGVLIATDAPIDPMAVEPWFEAQGETKPACRLTIEVPYPLTDADRRFWNDAPVIGYQPLVLAADVQAVDEGILWLPRESTMAWLEDLLRVLAESERGSRVLATLTAKGNFIWAPDNPDLYLDADDFGYPQTWGTPLRKNDDGSFSGDGQRGGDFEMWFWLVSRSELAREVRAPVARLVPTAVLVKSVVEGGRRARGRVVLSGEAPEVGIRVQMRSDNEILEVPDEVLVQPGATEAGFTVRTARPAHQESVLVTISATLGTTTLTQTVTVTAPG